MSLHKPQYPRDLAETNEIRLIEFLLELLGDPVMSRASHKLGISPSNGSRLLARAREWFKDDLFIRSAGRMVPTPRMLRLAPKLEALIATLDSVFDPEERFNPASIEATVRIVANDNAYFTLVAPVIAELREEAPGLRFAIVDRHPQILEWMRRGDVDLAVYSTEHEPVPKDFIERRLLSSRHANVVRRGHPLEAVLRKNGRLTIEEVEAYGRASAYVRMADGSAPVQVQPGFGAENVAAVTSPFFISTLSLLLETDLVYKLPLETAQKLTRFLPLSVLPLEDGVEMPWQPAVFWHRSTNDAPLMTWLRAKIVAYACRISANGSQPTESTGDRTVSTFEDATEHRAG